MRYKRLKLSVILIFGLSFIALKAQEAIISNGGSVSGYNGNLSYSIGQIVYQTKTGITGFLAEGLQQPYDISVVTAIEKAKGIKLSVSAYPNPANDFLSLTIENIEMSDLQYQLYNMNGNLLLNGELTDKQESIFIGHLVPSTYFVRIVQKGMEVITFKIVKK